MIDQVTNPTLVDVQFGEVAEILEQLRIEEEQGGLIEEVEVDHSEEIDQFDQKTSCAASAAALLMLLLLLLGHFTAD